jgi:hypothetical protein
MSEQLQHDMHLGADLVAAFTEGLLPAHEREQCLAHLADCPGCRKVVFTVQGLSDALPAPAPAPLRTGRRWFMPAPAWAAAALVVAVLTGALYLRVAPEEQRRNAAAYVPSPPPSVEAPAPQAPMTPPPERAAGAPTPPPAQAGQVRETLLERTEQRLLADASVSTPDPASPARDAAGPVQAADPAAEQPARAEAVGATDAPPVLVAQSAETPAAPAPALSIAVDAQPPTESSSSAPLRGGRAYTVNLAGLAGEVTDATGAVIAGATVTLRDPATGAKQDEQTDVLGRYELSGLEPGSYDLQVSAPGFQLASRRVDLQPRQTARVNSQLEVGSVAQEVAVTAQAPLVETSTSAVGAPSRSRRSELSTAARGLPLEVVVGAAAAALPSKLPAVTVLVRGRVQVAFDSAGAFFYSTNEGRRWRTIKQPWQGKVASLAPAPSAQSAIAAFQLTTDANVVWFSRDGSHWFAAPALP